VRFEMLRNRLGMWILRQEFIPEIENEGVGADANNVGPQQARDFEFLEQTCSSYKNFTQTPKDLTDLISAYIWKSILDQVKALGVPREFLDIIELDLQGKFIPIFSWKFSGID